MERTRQIVGIGLSFFLFGVVLTHIIGNDIRPDDLTYAILGSVAIGTAIIDIRASYYLQICIMLFGAIYIGVVDDNSRYISILIISFSYIGAVSYGFFAKRQVLSNVIWYIVVTSIFLVSCNFDLIETIKWALLVSFCHLAQWAFMRNIVQRARLADILENEKLKTTLVETVEAGMILSKEIKTRGAEHAAQG